MLTTAVVVICAGLATEQALARLEGIWDVRPSTERLLPTNAVLFPIASSTAVQRTIDVDTGDGPVSTPFSGTVLVEGGVVGQLPLALRAGNSVTVTAEPTGATFSWSVGQGEDTTPPPPPVPELTLGEDATTLGFVTGRNIDLRLLVDNDDAVIAVLERQLNDGPTQPFLALSLEGGPAEAPQYSDVVAVGSTVCYSGDVFDAAGNSTRFSEVCTDVTAESCAALPAPTIALALGMLTVRRRPIRKGDRESQR